MTLRCEGVIEDLLPKRIPRRPPLALEEVRGGTHLQPGVTVSEVRPPTGAGKARTVVLRFLRAHLAVDGLANGLDGASLVEPRLAVVDARLTACARCGRLETGSIGRSGTNIGMCVWK